MAMCQVPGDWCFARHGVKVSCFCGSPAASSKLFERHFVSGHLSAFYCFTQPDRYIYMYNSCVMYININMNASRYSYHQGLDGTRWCWKSTTCWTMSPQAMCQSLFHLCPLTFCTANGEWSSWSTSGTGSCSATCGTGTRLRSFVRQCNNPAPSYCGATCPGAGTKSEYESCNAGCCPGRITGGFLVQ